MLGLLVCVPPFGAYAAASQDAATPHAEVVRDEIAGLVLFPDGETPVVGLPVKVWSVDRKQMIYRTKTDGVGLFRIPRLRTERCYIFVGSVKIDLRILAYQENMLSQQHDIIVVTPRKLLLSRHPEILDLMIAPLILSLPKDTNVASP